MNHGIRKFAVALTVVVALCCAVVSAQIGMTPFSGDMSVKSKGGQNMNGKVYFSGTKMRMDMNAEGHEVAMIHDMPGKVTYMLMPQQHMYMEMHPGQNTPMRGPRMPDLKSYDPEHPCAAEANMTCEKVGSETMNGRSTDKWVFKNKDSGESTTAWIDKKLHFPVKTLNSEGSEMNLTNIQEGTPSASLFEIPSGYRKFDMGAMMGGRTPQ